MLADKFNESCTKGELYRQDVLRLLSLIRQGRITEANERLLLILGIIYVAEGTHEYQLFVESLDYFIEKVNGQLQFKIDILAN